MEIDNLITYGWALWCPIAGQLWDWGIDLKDEESRFVFEKSWFFIDYDKEDLWEHMEINDFAPHVEFYKKFVCIYAAQWPPLHVWIGAALRLLFVVPEMDHGYVVRMNNYQTEKIKVKLNGVIKEKLFSKWEELDHGSFFKRVNKCQFCFLRDLCWFLQEVSI